jgi:peptide-methionine (R)-S-oxide reductase
MYKCRVCRNSLFSFDDKFKSETGMASFWKHQPNSLALLDVLPEDPVDGRHVCCSECKCHVGRVHFDGPPPTFIRYEINSAALHFELKPFFEDPANIADRKKSAWEARRLGSRRDFLAENDHDI